MDEELLERLYKLAEYKGGILVRIAFNISEGMSYEQACVEAKRSRRYLDGLKLHHPDKEKEIREIAGLLSVERIKSANEQSVIQLRDSAGYAIDTLIKSLSARDRKVRLSAANSILDRIGVNPDSIQKVDATLRVELSEEVEKGLRRVYSDEGKDADSGKE